MRPVQGWREGEISKRFYPENLQVCVCGWNVRWNDLPKAEQNAYIRRAEAIAR